MSRPHQYLRNRVHGFFVFRNDSDVEDSREDENEARSRSGTCTKKENGPVRNKAYRTIQKHLLNAVT